MRHLELHTALASRDVCSANHSTTRNAPTSLSCSTCGAAFISENTDSSTLNVTKPKPRELRRVGARARGEEEWDGKRGTNTARRPTTPRCRPSPAPPLPRAILVSPSPIPRDRHAHAPVRLTVHHDDGVRHLAEALKVHSEVRLRHARGEAADKHLARVQPRRKRRALARALLARDGALHLNDATVEAVLRGRGEEAGRGFRLRAGFESERER